MYTDEDLETAVAVGLLTPDQAAAFRTHADARRAAPAVDEEQFRLITGFNDIFVSIAAILLLIAVAMIGRGLGLGAGAALVAAVSWGLAEYFTRKRRMALPSILLLLTFVGGVFLAIMGLFGESARESLVEQSPAAALRFAVAAGVAAIAAWLHWRRFRVPITVAAGAIAAVGTGFALLLSVVPGAADWLPWLLLAAGLGVFAFAMSWDMGDLARQTWRSDVAFWLHLLAAPMIAHPVFWASGLFSPGSVAVKSLGVIALYIGFGVIALAIDRRALLVSALGYVLYAISMLISQAGGVGTNFALTALVIGSVLLLLSAFWHRARAVVVSSLPGEWQAHLPRVERAAVTSG